MTQFDFGNLSSPLPGAELADGVLEPWRDALHSSHMGDSRPSYVVPGMWWIDNATTPWVAKVFQGSDDIVMGTLDPTTLVFVPSGTEAPTAAVTSYDPAGNTVITGTNVQDALDDVEPVLAGLGTAADEDVVDVRMIPYNPKTDGYVFAAEDSGTGINMPAGDDIITIPTNANVPIPVGSCYNIIKRTTGATKTRIARQSGVALRIAGTNLDTDVFLAGPFPSAVLYKFQTDTWIIQGAGVEPAP